MPLQVFLSRPYYIGIINPSIVDDLTSFASPREKWKYLWWYIRYVKFATAHGRMLPVPPEEFKERWKETIPDA